MCRLYHDATHDRNGKIACRDNLVGRDTSEKEKINIRESLLTGLQRVKSDADGLIYYGNDQDGITFNAVFGGWRAAWNAGRNIGKERHNGAQESCI